MAKINCKMRKKKKEKKKKSRGGGLDKDKSG
jgi:hypothetical protein